MGGRKTSFDQESGAVLLTTLLVLIAITVLGLASINKSIVELKIARNEREVRELFYLSEAACMEGIQRLQSTDNTDLNEHAQFWHHSKKSISDNRLNFRDPTHWDMDGLTEDNSINSTLNADTYIAAVEWTVATGGSLIQTQSRLYQNRIYGFCDKYDAENIIEMGYYMRY